LADGRFVPVSGRVGYDRNDGHSVNSALQLKLGGHFRTINEGVM
jgi:hypothetical protein